MNETQRQEARTSEMEQSVEASQKTASSMTEEDYSPIDALLVPERVVQLAILGITLNLAFNKLFDLDGQYQLIFWNGGVVLVALFVAGFSVYRNSGGNAELLPKFETIYLFYLPFMMLLLFDKPHALVNCGLILNCIDISLAFKLPMQGIFVLLSSNEADLEQKCSCLVAIVLNYVLSVILAKVSHLKSLDVIDCNLFSILLTNVLYINKPEAIYFQVLRGTLTAFLITVGINYVAAVALKRFHNNYVKSGLHFLTFVTVFPMLVKRLLRIDDQDPLDWLIHYISDSETRQTVLVIWITSLFILIPNVLVFKSNFTLNTSRKLWHFLILLLITKPFQMDPNFVKVSLAGSIVLFLSVEYLRYLKLEPVGGFLDSKLRLFADFRDDKGPIIISYIYLIIGIATPLLISNSPVGLISLGVGDSLASIIGGKWGRKRWPGTNKTIEGTIAFIVSTSLISLIFKQQLGYFENISFSNLVIVCTLSGLLEGNSTLNDNILIPAFMLITEKLLTV